MPAAAGRIAVYNGESALTDPIGAYTLTAVGTARYFAPGIVGASMFGPLTTTDYLKSDALRAALSGATTWGIQGYFTMTATNLAASPIVLTLGSTAGDSIVLRVLSSGQVRTIVDDVLVTDSSAGVVGAGRYHFALTFGSGALKAYCSPATAISSSSVFSVTDARPAWPASGSVWLGVYGPSPTLFTATQFLDEVGFFNTAPTSFPVLDTAPTLTAGAASGSTLNITWTDDTWDVLGYQVYRNTTNDSSTAKVIGRVAQGVQTFTDTGLAYSSTFYYWLRALKSCDLLGAFGTGVSSTTLAATAPNAPTSLAAGTPTASSVPITWTDAASPAAFYFIYKNTTNTSASADLVGVAEQGQESFTVSGLTDSTLYYFWAKALSAEGALSSFTSSVSATTSAAAVGADTATAFAVTTTGRDSVRLTWTDGASTEAQLVYRHTADSFAGASVIGGVDAGEQLYTDSGLASGTQYFYWLLPLGTGGPGTQTSSVNATTYGAAGNPGTDIVSQIVTAAKTRLAAVLSSDFEQLKYVKDLKKNGRTPWGYGILIGDEEPTEPSVFGSYTAEMALQVVLYRAPNAIQNDRDIEEAELTLEQWKDRVHREFTTTRLYENDVIVLISDPSVTPEYFEDSEAVALRLTFPVKYRNSRA